MAKKKLTEKEAIEAKALEEMEGKEQETVTGGWHIPTDEKLPRGWERLDREDGEPLYRDMDYNEYVKDDYGRNFVPVEDDGWNDDDVDTEDDDTDAEDAEDEDADVEEDDDVPQDVKDKEADAEASAWEEVAEWAKADTKDEEVERYKEIEPLEFREDGIPLVGYDDTIIGDTEETTFRRYMNLHIAEHPDVRSSIDDGCHSFEGCMEYVRAMVQKTKGKGSQVAMVTSDKVFRLVVNYYMSPVVEKTRTKHKASGTKGTASSWDSEEAREQRRMAEERRKEEEHRKAREKDIARNGLSLFDF